MKQDELEKHAKALWALCVGYITEHHLEAQTAGILIVEARADNHGDPPLCCVQYAGTPKDAGMIMVRTAMAELHRAGVKMPGTQ